MEYYRDILRKSGLESFPLPGSGSALSVQNNAQAILDATGDNVIPSGDASGAPSVQVLPAQGSGTNTPVVEQVPNTVLVNPAGSGSALMAWVKKNPLPAVGIAVGAIWLISELTKGGKK